MLQVDVPILQDCFELQPFGGLMRYTGDGVDPSLLHDPDGAEVTGVVPEPATEEEQPAEPAPPPPIVIENHYKYKDPADKDKVVATLDKIIEYNQEKEMLGPVATTFAFKHCDDGLSYQAIEVFPDAAAYEAYAACFLGCPFLEEIMAMSAMVEEMPEGVKLYGEAEELAKSPVGLHHDVLRRPERCLCNSCPDWSECDDTSRCRPLRHPTPS